jgi:hypothetical protein
MECLFYLTPRSFILSGGMYWVNQWSANHQNLSPNKKSQKDRTYLGFWPDSRKLGRTYLAPSPYMSGFLLIVGLAQLSRTYPGPRSGFSNPSQTCPAPAPDMSSLTRDPQRLSPRWPHLAPYLGSREFSQTCLAPSLDMFDLSVLNPG